MAVRLIKFVSSRAGGIERKANFFQVADEFLASRADEKLRFAEVIAEARVDAVDAVADLGVDFGLPAGNLDVAFVNGGEELADQVPVGGGGGGAPLVAGGVAVDVHIKRAVDAADDFQVGRCVLDEDAMLLVLLNSPEDLGRRGPYGSINIASADTTWSPLASVLTSW